MVVVVAAIVGSGCCWDQARDPALTGGDTRLTETGLWLVVTAAAHSGGRGLCLGQMARGGRATHKHAKEKKKKKTQSLMSRRQPRPARSTDLSVSPACRLQRRVSTC